MDTIQTNTQTVPCPDCGQDLTLYCVVDKRMVRPATLGECTQSDTLSLYAAQNAEDVRRIMYQDDFCDHGVYRVAGGFLVHT